MKRNIDRIRTTHAGSLPRPADILQMIRAKSRGEAVDEQKLGVMKAMTEGMIDKESDPYFATARLWDDGVIDPAQTRTVLGLALSACANAPLEEVGYGVFRM